MFPSFTNGPGFATCSHLGLLAIVSPDRWSVYRGTERVATGPDTGGVGRAAALAAIRAEARAT